MTLTCVVTTMLPDVLVNVTLWAVTVGTTPWGVLQPVKQRATPAMAMSKSIERRRLLASGSSSSAPRGKTAATTMRVCMRPAEATVGVLAAAAMVAVIMLGAVPAMTAGAGTLQVIDATGLEQVTVTWPVKPATGVIASVAVPLEPAAICREAGVAATVKVGVPVVGGAVVLPETFSLTLPKENEE